MFGNYSFVELVGFVNAIGENLLELPAQESGGRWPVAKRLISQSQTNSRRLTRGNRQFVIRPGLGPFGFGIHCLLIAMDDIIVNAILCVTRSVCEIEEPPCVGIVFSEQQFGRAFTVQPALA